MAWSLCREVIRAGFLQQQAGLPGILICPAHQFGPVLLSGWSSLVPHNTSVCSKPGQPPGWEGPPLGLSTPSLSGCLSELLLSTHSGSHASPIPLPQLVLFKICNEKKKKKKEQKISAIGNHNHPCTKTQPACLHHQQPVLQNTALTHTSQDGLGTRRAFT